MPVPAFLNMTALDLVGWSTQAAPQAGLGSPGGLACIIPRLTLKSCESALSWYQLSLASDYLSPFLLGPLGISA